jgi:hypothetical protein
MALSRSTVSQAAPRMYRIWERRGAREKSKKVMVSRLPFKCAINYCGRCESPDYDRGR